MRSIFLASFAFFLFSSCNSSSSVDLQNPERVRKSLTAAWQTEYMETRSTRTKIPEGMVSDLTLKEDGSYSVGLKDGEIKQNGQWNYDALKQMLIMHVENEATPSRILKLTSKELVCSEYLISNGEIQDSTVITYKRL